jgi:nitrogen fixation protein NifU and related proteins
VSELRDLYQEVILDHNRRPRNFVVLEPHSHHAHGYNPLCGDKVQVYLNVRGDLIEAASFRGEGCAISTASASIMTELLQGRTLEQAHALFEAFRHLLMDSEPAAAPEEKLAVLAGVREYPSRVKCATLPWHAFEAALAQQGEVSTEQEAE